jgi:DNA-binding Lrp family transcriptional regulator
MSKGEGIEAYELLVVDHGTDEEILRDLIKIEGITEASLVYGEFDIHCKIEVDTMDELKEVIKKIRKLRIITSETLIAYEGISKKQSRLTNRHIRNIHRNRARR